MGQVSRSKPNSHGSRVTDQSYAWKLVRLYLESRKENSNDSGVTNRELAHDSHLSPVNGFLMECFPLESPSFIWYLKDTHSLRHIRKSCEHTGRKRP